MNENNQSFLQQNMGSIILIVFVAVVFWGYTVFFKALPVSDSSRPVSPVGQEVVQVLQRLEGISLDGSFFETLEFQHLKEFELVIPTQTVGRLNPFTAIK